MAKRTPRYKLVWSGWMQKELSPNNHRMGSIHGYFKTRDTLETAAHETFAEIRIQPTMVNGEPTGDPQIFACDETIGWFTVDNNENLWDKDLPHFVLEYRDETAWALLPVSEKRQSTDKGWNQTSPRELIEILQSTGVIQ